MNILISGASIAGPALAHFLSNDGHRVTVVERAPALRPGGYAVDIRGAGLEVVERMGLRDAMRPLETDTLSNSLVDARGRVYGRSARGFGVVDPGDVEIHRGDLARLLYEATRESAEYRFGDSVASIVDAGERVHVRFESGLEGDYDAVIGADGVHSRTRRLVFGDESTYFRPLGAAMAIFTIPNFLGLDREQWLFQARGRIASVKSASENRELKVAVFFASDDGPSLDLDVDAQRSRVADAYRDAGWVFPRILDSMMKAEDFYFDRTGQIRMPGMVRGRVALVGDAGSCPSPLTGQGTSLALVGAYVLAAELSASPHDAVSAFARYDARMRPFVVRNQELVESVAKGFMPASELEAKIRGIVMNLMRFLPGDLFTKLSMGKVREVSRAIELGAQPA